MGITKKPFGFVDLVVLFILCGNNSIAETETYSAIEDGGGVPASMPMEDGESLDPVTTPIQKAAPKTQSEGGKRSLSHKARKRTAERAPSRKRETARDRSMIYSRVRESTPPVHISSGSVDQRLALRDELKEGNYVPVTSGKRVAAQDVDDELDFPSPPQVTRSEPAAPVSEATTGYDPVPGDQVDTVANRLQIVEQILRKYGRAYDYRILTASQLMRIYKSLGSNTADPVSYN